MDQSTQVNFPTTMRLLKKRLQRHSTATDVRSSIRRLRKSSPWMNNDSLPSAIPQLKLSAQRALNIPTETLQRSNLNDIPPCSPNSRNSHTPSAELPLGIISQGQTSPLSSSSSIITSNCSQQPNYLLQSPHKLYSSHTGSGSQHFFQVPLLTYHNETNNSCKCFNKYNIGSKPSATPEGLSWRRLHMSRAKLKATSTTSELLSGFAMVAMVELQINEDTAVPEWLFVMFSICTTVLVAVHIFALMISTYILPNIDAISKLDVCELVTESPHERMKGFIELAWAFSTVLGLFLFLVEVAILCWVKFWDYSFTAAIAATVIVIPVLVIFVLFAVHFYHSLVVHKCDTSVSDMQRLEDMKKHLDEATSPA